MGEVVLDSTLEDLQIFWFTWLKAMGTVSTKAYGTRPRDCCNQVPDLPAKSKGEAMSYRDIRRILTYTSPTYEIFWISLLEVSAP